MSCTKPKITKVQMNLGSIQGTCRVCMRKNNSMKQLFDSDSKIVDRIQFCTGILFTENLIQSSLICTECLSQLNIALSFKTACIASDVLFKKLDVKVEIKTENFNDTSVKKEIEDLYEDEAKIEDLNHYVGSLIANSSNPTKKIGLPCPKPTINEDLNCYVGSLIVNSSNPTKKIGLPCPKPTINEDLSCYVKSLKANSSNPTKKIGLPCPNPTINEDLNCYVKSLIANSSNPTKEIGKPCSNSTKNEDLNCNVGSLIANSSNPTKKIGLPCPKPTINEDLSCYVGSLIANSSNLTGTSSSNPALKGTSMNTIKLEAMIKEEEKRTQRKVKCFAFRKLYCARCNIKFESKEESIKHYETVHNSSQYVCEVCGKQFLYQTSHKRHMRIHNGRLYACEHCPYTTVSKPSLRTHLVIHTDQKNFHCDSCPGTFRTAANLRSHIMYKHGGQKTFSCDRCDKSFFGKQSLSRHMDTHDNIKQYACTVCSARFNQRKNWKRHLLSQHAVTVPLGRPGPRKTMYSYRVDASAEHI